MSRVDMSRRVSVLMGCKSILDLGLGGKSAFVKAVDQADDMSQLNPHYQDVILAAEQELQAKGYVRDSKGRLRPPEFADNPEIPGGMPPGVTGAKEHKRLIVSVKGNAKER